MRHEFAGRSSGQSKSDLKRSGTEKSSVEQKASAVSLYGDHNAEEPTFLDTHDDGTVEVIDDLDHKSVTNRNEARRMIMSCMSRNVADRAMIKGAGTIVGLSCKALSASCKWSATEREASIELAVATALCCADSSGVTLFDEVATSIVHYLSRPLAALKAASGRVTIAAIKGLTMIAAVHPQAIVDGEGSIDDALFAVTPDSQTSVAQRLGSQCPFGDERAAALTLLASVAPVTKRTIVKSLALDTLTACSAAPAPSGPEEAAHVATVIGSLECIGILNQRFPGTVLWQEDLRAGEVVPVLGSKAIVMQLRGLERLAIIAGRNGTSEPLDPVLVSDDSPAGSPTTIRIGGNRKILANGQPTETIQFRERSAEITGYLQLTLLSILRELVGEGLLSFIAKNNAIRRVFEITEDLTSKMSKSDVRAEREDLEARKAEKESVLKDRSTDRKKKHLDRLDHGDFEDETS